jgi:hypothetical protein
MRILTLTFLGIALLAACGEETTTEPASDIAGVSDTSTPNPDAVDGGDVMAVDTHATDASAVDGGLSPDITENDTSQALDVPMTDAAPPSDAAPPGNMDSDMDGLPDAEEAILGTDPLDPDTDGDGYLDGHEVTEGKDPLDPESRIYHGNWPYNPDKDDVDGPGWDKCVDGQCIGKGSCDPADEGVDGSPWEDPTGCSLKEGLQLPRWSGKDQYGDSVDLYDFLGTGKPIVLDVGTPFCKPCKGLAAFFSTGDPNHTTAHAPDPLNSFAWWKPEYEVILDLINNDEIHWITIVWSSCVGGNPVDEAAGAAWHDEWPHPKIPVLVDPDCKLKDYLNVKAMPHIDVLDPDLVFTTYVTNGPTAAMKALSAL